jgi:hypothetical protein
MERFSFIFLIAGLGFFILAFAVSAYLPMLPVSDLEVKTVEELAADPPVDFIELKEQYPRAYRRAFYNKSDEQAMTELQQQFPDVFAAMFSKTDEQAIQFLMDSAPETFVAVFGEDYELEDALDDFYFERDDILAKIKQQDPESYTAAFDTSVRSALLTLDADYAMTLLKIKKQSPEAYEAIFEERTDSDVLAEALRTGHAIYVAEACWHCHSQQVRPWGRDDARYGQISYPEEYHNELNYPPLWGTRRIGPDLIRRGGKQSNDWHVAHFWRPKDVVPDSVMPNFPWFYEDDGMTLNKKGLSIIAYVQWLGSWQESRDETIYNAASIERAYDLPEATSP